MRPTEPPARGWNTSSKPPRSAASEAQGRGIDEGNGDIGCDARNVRETRVKKMEACELLGLGNGDEVKFGCHGVRCGRHQDAPSETRRGYDTPGSGKFYTTRGRPYMGYRPALRARRPK